MPFDERRFTRTWISTMTIEHASGHGYLLAYKKKRPQYLDVAVALILKDSFGLTHG